MQKHLHGLVMPGGSEHCIDNKVILDMINEFYISKNLYSSYIQYLKLSNVVFIPLEQFPNTYETINIAKVWLRAAILQRIFRKLVWTICLA